jgi:hypothetical protein
MARAPGRVRRIEITFPEIDVHDLLRLGGRTPELDGGEADAVQVLRVLAETVSVGVGKDVDAPLGGDDTPTPPRVAR